MYVVTRFLTFSVFEIATIVLLIQEKEVADMKMERRIQLTFIIFLAACCYIKLNAQGTYTSAASTGWTTASTWTCTGTCNNYPGEGSNDDIVEIGNHSVTLASTTVTVSSILLTSSGTSTSRLTLSGTSSLTVSGDVIITKGSSGTTQLRLGGLGTASSSTMTIGGNLTYNYNNGGESAAEISVGSNTTGDASVDDNCSLFITNNLLLSYSYNSSSSSSDFLEIRIGNQNNTASPHVNSVKAGNFTVSGTSTSVFPKVRVSLFGNSSLFDIGASGTTGTGTISVSSVSSDATNYDMSLVIDGAATGTGTANSKILDIGDGASVTARGTSTTILNVSNPGATALSISGTSKTSELIVTEDADASIDGNALITRDNTSNSSVRLRVGGSAGITSTSTVTINGNLEYNYQNTGGTESQIEISVGNSSNPDACSLNITGNVTLKYEFPSTTSGNVLAFEVGNASSASMNNLILNSIEAGSGTGSDIRVATNGSSGASIIVNGDASMNWTDASGSNSNAEIYLKPGNDGATSSTSFWVKGNLYMNSEATTGSINNTVRVAGNSTFTLGQTSGGGNIYFSASAPTGESVENRITLIENGTFNIYGSINNDEEGSFDFKPTGTSNPNSTTPNGTFGLYGTSANSSQSFPIEFRSNVYPDNNYKNVVINNSSGTILTVPLSTLNIEGSLTMTDGIINSTTSNQLVLEDGATSNGGTSTSYVTGPVLKKGGLINNDLVFPIGKGAIWAPLEISNLSGSNSSTTFAAEYFDDPYSTLTTDGTFHHASGGEYWNLQVVGTPTVDLTLYWKSACWSEIYDLSTGVNQDLFIGHFNGTVWNKLTGTYTLSGSAGSIATCPGSFTGSIKVTGVSSFSPFTFIAQAATINPLPIELDKFWCERKGNSVNILWSTLSELNSDFFVLQRSSNGSQFSSIDTIQAAGTSTEYHLYEVVDQFPNAGINYYRLLEIDRDGALFDHGVVSIILNQLEQLSIEIFPNPVSNGVLNIYTRTDEVYKESSFKVYSITGEDITGSCRFTQLEVSRFQIDTRSVIPGVYLLLCRNESSNKLLKFLVE